MKDQNENKDIADLARLDEDIGKAFADFTREVTQEGKKIGDLIRSKKAGRK